MVLPIKFQAQVLRLLHDGQGHQGIERTIALCRERFYWNTMFQDVTRYVKECPRCQIAKGDYTEPNTIPGVIIASNPMDLVCIDFTKVDPSKDGKENILVLTDAFTKFSQAFVTPNQKAITVAKILVDKWFYTYGIPARIHSDKGRSFDNEIMSHLYGMYGVEESTTMPYNPRGNAPTERMNRTLINLLKSLPKSRRATGRYICHHWCLPIMPHPMIQLATSHMSLCLVAKLQLCVTHGSGWQIIMTTFCRASVHG